MSNSLDEIIYDLCRRIQQNEPLEMDDLKQAILLWVSEEIVRAKPVYATRPRGFESDKWKFVYDRIMTAGEIGIEDFEANLRREFGLDGEHPKDVSYSLSCESE